MYPESGGLLVKMDIRQQIVNRVDQLPLSGQKQVLRFVESLAGAEPVGEPGSSLRQFAGAIDSVSAGQMWEAIEKECEQVDAGQW